MSCGSAPWRRHERPPVEHRARACSGPTPTPRGTTTSRPRWAEAAEAQLLPELGLQSLFRVLPRAHVEADYLKPASFHDEVETTMAAEVRRSSLWLSFHVPQGGGTVARGSFAAVRVGQPWGRSTPWPEAVRPRLGG